VQSFTRYGIVRIMLCGIFCDHHTTTAFCTQLPFQLIASHSITTENSDCFYYLRTKFKHIPRDDKMIRIKSAHLDIPAVRREQHGKSSKYATYTDSK